MLQATVVVILKAEENNIFIKGVFEEYNDILKFSLSWNVSWLEFKDFK